MDAWLSGFIYAEGCFTCSVYDNKSNTAKLVRLSYILSQKGNYDNMDHLADIVGGKNHLLKKSNKRN